MRQSADWEPWVEWAGLAQTQFCHAAARWPRALVSLGFMVKGDKNFHFAGMLSAFLKDFLGQEGIWALQVWVELEKHCSILTSQSFSPS